MHSPTPTHTYPHSPTPTHIQSKKGHTHPHPPTPAKKRSYSPTPTQKNVTIIHTHPHLAKKGHTHPYPPTPREKRSHPTKRSSYPPTHNRKKECHVSKTYVKVFPFHNISSCLHFWKRLTSSSFSIEYFWNGIWIYCLFVCFQQLANDISKNSKVRKWEMCKIFLSSFIICYFFCITSSNILCTVHKVVHV